MLDSEIKKKINNARDILVGKVPDPKSQVEQITLALIYKFMDDMDMESVEYGGKATFFTGEYTKYAWTKLFDPKLGSFGMFNLYSEALAKLPLNTNKNFPQLFRDIFKNAYLPYRDPETLKLFLKEINGFTYDHSEKLGDAFEYLLSVLGAQGDAGQFRTPRHIIDFIVAILDPKKNETICDPACGTSGFLISGYKHILENNKKKVPGDKLTPDERKQLVKNFKGYDISPDMVRLSLVNMYLHKFTNPQITEYDTLTSDEKWNEVFDIVLANPPFMTPKGGIKPHKRFSVQCNKSEVLFVDYIAEHINPATGRAAIIVPNGIVATTQTAYTQLRKMLVQDSLIAVISLPAGVFNPYSGVKTSILILDKWLAKKTDNILFLKIENDGFDLGAQRREIGKNDLPEVLQVMADFKTKVLIGVSIGELPKMATAVTKETILTKKHVILTQEHYFEKADLLTEYPTIKIADTIDAVVYPNKILKQHFLSSGRFPIIDQSEAFIAGYWNESDDVFKVQKPVIIFGDHTRIFKYVDFDFVLGADGVKILKPISEIDSKFYYYLLKSLEVKNLGYSRHFRELKEMEIPLPPLEIQQQIVTEIEGYQKHQPRPKQVVENYKPTINIKPEWEMVELQRLCDVRDGTHDSPKYVLEGGVPFVTQKNITKDGLSLDDINYISQEDHKKIIKRSEVAVGDILISMIGANRGMSCIVDVEKEFSIKNVGLIKSLNKINQTYLLYYLKSTNASEYIALMSSGGAQQFIGLTSLRNFPIRVPTTTEQQMIVSDLQEEQRLVEANKRLIEIFEQKIKDKINEVWGIGKKESGEESAKTGKPKKKKPVVYA